MELVQTAVKLQQLLGFVYVSEAYTNVTQTVVEHWAAVVNCSSNVQCSRDFKLCALFV